MADEAAQDTTARSEDTRVRRETAETVTETRQYEELPTPQQAISPETAGEDYYWTGEHGEGEPGDQTPQSEQQQSDESQQAASAETTGKRSGRQRTASS
jgi:hypothetical protein